MTDKPEMRKVWTLAKGHRVGDGTKFRLQVVTSAPVSAHEANEYVQHAFMTALTQNVRPPAGIA